MLSNIAICRNVYDHSHTVLPHHLQRYWTSGHVSPKTLPGRVAPVGKSSCLPFGAFGHSGAVGGGIKMPPDTSSSCSSESSMPFSFINAKRSSGVVHVLACSTCSGVNSSNFMHSPFSSALLLIHNLIRASDEKCPKGLSTQGTGPNTGDSSVCSVPKTQENTGNCPLCSAPPVFLCSSGA